MEKFITEKQAKESDIFYWNLTKERITAATAPIRQNVRIVAALAATGAAFGLGGLLVAVRAFMRRRDF